MTKDILRAALRARTAYQHERLDRAVGLFETREQYAAFLVGSRRFRAAAESAVDGRGSWKVEQLSDLLDADLADLGRAPGPPAQFPEVPANDAFALGIAYVLEGSALGARLLARRAAGLGFDGEHGARHLARQTGDKERWRRFLDALDAVEPDYQEQVLAGAASAFDFALEAYAVAPQ